MEILLYDFGIFVHHIVISPNKMKPAIDKKQPEKLVHIFMSLKNGFKLNILPQLIPVPEFNIVEAFIVILFQGMEIDVSVIGKFIRKAIIPPVAIAEKDKFGIVIEWDSFGIGVGPVQTFNSSHE
jgi:hypothetical protein